MTRKKTKPSFEEYYKTVPSFKNDTTNYNLRRAYDLAPYKDMLRFSQDPNFHLNSVYKNDSTGIYDFVKSKNHPTINKELDWYNSQDGESFRKQYDLDKSGEYYRYVPRYENGMKRKISKQIPSYAFGIDQVLGLTEMLGAGVQAFGRKNTVDPGYEATQSGSQQLGGALMGGAKGAMTGLTMGGPVGAVVGAGVGILGSAFGGAKKNREIRKRNMRRRTQNQTNAGLDIQAGLEQDYYDENDLAYTFANGGMVNANLAYVDNDEVLRDVDGNITQVPDTMPGTDQHLIDAYPLESVLSDKLKVPGTKKTFAETMAKHINKPKSAREFTDKYSEGREAAEEMAQQMLYNDLLMQQEQVKQAKGIKPKTKGIPAFAYGTPDVPPITELPEVTVTAPRLYNGLTEAELAEVNSIMANVKQPYNRSITPGKMVKPAYVDDEIPGNYTLPTGSTQNQDLFVSDRKSSNDLLGDLTSLTPTFYNWIKGMSGSEYESPVQNPYSGSIRRSMARRRMNINPMIDANRMSRSIANYNASNLNANTGANLALRTQMATDEYRNNANMYSTKQNTDNQYFMDYANTLNSLGQQNVAAQLLANDNNAKNRAAARNYTASAASQIGQWAQVQQQMKNQRNRDDMTMPLMAEFLKAGYTKAQVEQLMSKYYG